MADITKTIADRWHATWVNKNPDAKTMKKCEAFVQSRLSKYIDDKKCSVPQIAGRIAPILLVNENFKLAKGRNKNFHDTNVTPEENAYWRSQLLMKLKKNAQDMMHTLEEVPSWSGDLFNVVGGKLDPVIPDKFLQESLSSRLKRLIDVIETYPSVPKPKGIKKGKGKKRNIYTRQLMICKLVDIWYEVTGKPPVQFRLSNRDDYYNDYHRFMKDGMELLGRSFDARAVINAAYQYYKDSISEIGQSS